MQAPLEGLVESLYRRLYTEAGESVSPPTVFAIATDIAASLSPLQRGEQLDRVLTVLESSVSCVAGDLSEVHLPQHCAPFLVGVTAALVSMTVHAGLQGEQLPCESHLERWGAAVLRVLRAHPSHLADTVSAGCHGAAQLIVAHCGGGGCVSVLEAACAALLPGSGETTEVEEQEGIPVSTAVEVMSECASLLVTAQPVEWSGAALAEAQANDAIAASAAMARPSTRSRPADGAGRAAQQERRAAGGLEGVAEVHLPATAAVLLSESERAALQWREEVREQLVACSLQALGSGASQHRDPLALALLCRRVLIPLLTGGGAQGSLLRHEAAVHCLVTFLAAQEERRDDVVVLIAALFDFLFRRQDLDPGHDYRFSDILWAAVQGALWESLTADSDCAHRASMQARAEYLLKRIVHITKEQEHPEKQKSAAERHSTHLGRPTAVPLPHTMQFHRVFCWTRGKTAQLWEHFFLVLGTLSEYGWHIIQPVMRKLDALVAALEESLLDGGAGSGVGALHACWVELLLLKMIRHPNIGVRKVGLRRIWGMSSTVLSVFSQSFLFTHLFNSSSDYRLCAEVDRTPLVSDFLSSARFEGRELLAVPNVQPLVHEVETFYARVFLEVLRSAVDRRAAWRLVLASVADQPPRYTVSVLLRVMHHIARSTLAIMREPGASAEERALQRECALAMALDPEAIQVVSGILREFAQENAPFWLDVRLTAIMFDALLLFAVIDPAAFRGNADFWRLACLCGPMGQSGGRGHARMAAGGQYGYAGANIDVQWLQRKLVQVSVEQQQLGDVAGVGEVLLHGLLQTPTLVERTRQLLQERRLDEARVKQQFFLVGSLAGTGEEADLRLVTELCEMVAAEVASLRSRGAVAHGPFLISLASFVELHHELGAAACARLISGDVLGAIAEAVHIHANAALVAATEDARCLTDTEYFQLPAWELMYTAAWDVIAAAAMTANQLLSHQEFVGTTGVEVNGKWIATLAEMVYDLAIMFEVADSGVSAEVAAARRSAAMVVARNASRLLQCELTGCLRGGTEDCSQSTATWSISSRGRVSSDAAEGIIRALTKSLTQRHTSASAACPLSVHSWPTLLTQHFRSIYVSIQILCLHLEVPSAVVPEVAEFALRQIEESWTSNLDCVYGQLAWLVAEGGDAVDRLTLVESMLEHTHDVSAKQHACLSFYAFSSLCFTMPGSPAFFIDVLRKTLSSSQVCDRDVYFASMAASLQVLRHPHESWGPVEGILLEVAVMFNSGRDEEENDSTMSSTESLMVEWPRELRERYPPTVRLAVVGRALAISTILWRCQGDPEFALDLTLRLLDMNVSNPLVTHEPCMPNSRTHRIRIRLWQLLCALLPLLPSTHHARRAVFVAHAAKCLTVTNMGSVRRLMELYAIKLMELEPSLYDVVSTAMADYNQRPQVYGSYVLIACHSLLRQETVEGVVEEPGMFAALFQRLLQQSTSNQHLLRIISHIGVYKVCCARVARGRPVPPEALAIFDYVATAAEHVKFREKHEATLFFDTSEACGPRGIFCLQRKEANVLLHESIPAAMFERVRFLEGEISSLIGATFPIEWLPVHSFCSSLQVLQLLDQFRDFEYIPHARHRTNNFVDYTIETMEFLAADASGPCVKGSGDGGEASDNIQKKVTPWWTSEVCNELHPRALQSVEKQSLVVVGSLLENPVNIAGLCRCGEIFAVEKIVVPHRKVFEHPHFVATARSAELWIPWEEVSPKELVNFLELKRREGYSIIGIEQTASSVSMATYFFPKRAVVLLGAEGQGVPAPLIPLLDVCVEIPQFGLIRSLNVHVTGAVVMYEYTKQHLMSKSS